MKIIGTLDGTTVDVCNIVGMYIQEKDSKYRIILVCNDGVYTFDEYPTHEKAERYFYDLVSKVEYVQRKMASPSNLA